MNTRVFIPSFFLTIILLASCATPFKQIKNTNVPFERSYYSILPPQEKGWTYVDRVEQTPFKLAFRKEGESKTHTFVAIVYEMHNDVSYSDPEAFLAFVQVRKALDINTRRYKVLEQDISLHNRFGSLCVRSYIKSEDYGARNKGGLGFLTMEGYSYTFIHPNNNELIIDISYSERGVAGEMNPKFTEVAEMFIDGLKIK